MSRCFPYPPPGYCKNGATTHEALIESIKLQKETEKVKSERKREKREKKEKKQKDKDKRKDKKKLKSQNKPLLERSDVTEEHGQPSSSLKPSYSSDSTQNSNKRKSDHASLPEVATGKPIKIRLLKKLKGPDSTNEIDRPLVPVTSGTENNAVNLRETNSNSLNGLHLGRTQLAASSSWPVTSARENIAVNVQETKKSNANGLHLGRTQLAASSSRPSAPFSHLNHQTPVGRIVKKSEVPVASRSRNSDEEMLQFSREPVLQSCGRPVLTPGQINIEIPGSSKIVAPKVSSLRPINVQGLCPDSSKNLLTSTGKRTIDEIQEPFNGSIKPGKKVDPIVEVIEKVAPTRHEKKLLKKQSKYEKLVGCWVPPVLETQLPDEEDWLLRRGKTVKSSSRDDVETCKETTVSSLWQPCARFLVEADVYALPYTVPF